MRCPECDSPKTKVLTQDIIISNEGDNVNRRFRKCPNGHTFYSYECYEVADVEVVFKARAALGYLSTAVSLLDAVAYNGQKNQ